MNLKIYSTFYRQFCGWFGMKNQIVNFKKIELAKSNQIKSIYTKFLFSAAFFFCWNTEIRNDNRIFKTSLNFRVQLFSLIFSSEFYF